MYQKKFSDLSDLANVAVKYINIQRVTTPNGAHMLEMVVTTKDGEEYYTRSRPTIASMVAMVGNHCSEDYFNATVYKCKSTSGKVYIRVVEPTVAYDLDYMGEARNRYLEDKYLN